MDPAFQRRWLEQWNEASAALEEHRRSELRGLSESQALAAADALLSLAATSDLPSRRRTHSGLVEQQSLFHGRRRSA